MHKPLGADRYEPITWDAAFQRIAEVLHGLPSPDAAAFYTSGRTSNEAAFLYQLMVRRFGTNNLPDCSNMCHESSGAALAHSIGIGKGSVLLEDIYAADLIMVVGQNPGTNHPRMLSALEAGEGQRRPHRQRQPARRGGAAPVPQPADPQGPDQGRRPHRRLPPGPPQRRPGAVRGAGEADHRGRCGRRGVRRQAHLRVRRVPPLPRQARLGRRPRGDRADPRGDRAGRPALPGVRPRHRLLGDGPDPAQGSRGHDPGDHQPAPPARQHRQARCRPVPGPRTLQRAGRPDHGRVGEGARRPARRAEGRVRLRAQPRARARLGRHAARDARGEGARVLRRGRQLRLGDTRHGTHRGGHAVPGPDRARLDQAQPLARGDRERGDDPALPGPHRARPPGQRRPGRHGRGLDGHGARLARPARPRVPGPALRGRDRHPAGRGALAGGDERHRLGGHAPRLLGRSATTSSG